MPKFHQKVPGIRSPHSCLGYGNEKLLAQIFKKSKIECLAFSWNFWLFLGSVTREYEHTFFSNSGVICPLFAFKTETLVCKIDAHKQFLTLCFTRSSFQEFQIFVTWWSWSSWNLLQRIHTKTHSSYKTLISKHFDMHFAVERARMAKIFDDFRREKKFFTGSCSSHCLL